jgi:hypothetical protein
MFGGGLGHDATDEVVGEEMCIELFLEQLGCAAAEHIHFQGCLEVVQTHFESPATQVGLQNFLSWVAGGVQQGGDQRDSAHPETFDVATAANDANGDFLWQSQPEGHGQPEGRVLSPFPNHEPIVLAQVPKSAAAVRAAGGTADEIDLWLQVSQQGQEDKITEPPVSHEDVVGDQLAEHLVEHRQFGGTQITTGEGQDGPTE